MTSQQEREEKLDFAARLSGLLLNEGTDVMRWFLMDNIPRRIDEEPNLEEILQANRELFQSFVENGKDSMKEKKFGYEFLDILFPPCSQKADERNMEISLLFILIKFLCKINKPNWKWWDEDPQPHQSSPVFDVIRLSRFKDKMRNVVHDYEITKEIFSAQLGYLTSIIERLRGYKLSAQRWKDEFISYKDDIKVTKDKKTLDILVIMRWQTMTIEERDEIYLVMKKNFQNITAGQKEDVSAAWESFISGFGQMVNMEICEINELCKDQSRRELFAEANDISNRSYLSPIALPSKYLNWEKVFDLTWKRRMEDVRNKKNSIAKREPRQTKVDECSLKGVEKTIYENINDSVFVRDSPSEDPVIRTVCKKWKKKVIASFCTVSIFPFQSSNTIHMDDIIVHLARDKVLRVSYNETLRQVRERTSNSPLRIIVSGERCSGKTTFLRKIAYDRATRNVPTFLDHDIVMYVDLFEIPLQKPYTKIADVLLSQCLNVSDEITSGELEDLLKSRNGKGILFLFDNLDLLPGGIEMSEILDVLKSYLWNECSILVAVSNELFDISSSRSREILSKSRFPWQRFSVTGFNFHEIKDQVRKHLRCTDDQEDNQEEKSCSGKARHLTNLLRVFQRDVYLGKEFSPVLLHILCHAWTLLEQRINASDTSEGDSTEVISLFPDTMFGVMKLIFSRYIFSVEEADFDFPNQMVYATLSGNCFDFFKVNIEAIQILSLVDCGILHIKKGNGYGTSDTVHFAHPVLQSYFASWYYCIGKNKENLKHRLTSTSTISRLRHFFIFCCGQHQDVANDILNMLKDYIESGDNLNQETTRTYLDLCLQCYEASSHVDSRKGHLISTAAIRSSHFHEDVLLNNIQPGLITTALTISNVQELSSNSKQALLSFVGACRPPLTRSGTTFPLLRSRITGPSSSFINVLTINELSGKQIGFVVGLISNLPFLEEIHLFNISKIHDGDFQRLCSGLVHQTNGIVSAVHSLTLTFKLATKLDVIPVSTLEPLGNALRYLPHLDALHLQPLSYQLFTSLYENSQSDVDNLVLPIANINLSKADITEILCQKLKTLLRRSLLTKSLTLSQNPIHSGLRHFEDEFSHFRYLEELSLEECCLTAESIQALSRAMHKLSSSLTSLNLKRNYVKDESALLSLVNTIGHLKELQKLNLSFNFLRNRVICVLATGLHDLKKLRELHLDYVQMGEIGLSSLHSHILDLSNMEVLSLGENPLGSDALKCISSLSDNTVTVLATTLREVKISGISTNVGLHIKSDAVKSFSAALKHFTKLRVLDMQYTIMSYSDMITLLYACEEHTMLVELRMTESLLPLTSAEMVTWTCLKLF